METAILILAMSAVVFVMYWLVKNDGAPTIADQKGLLRMMPPRDADAAAAAEDARRRASTVNRRPS